MRLSSVFLILLMLALSACSWLPEQVDETAKLSASELYEKAKASLDNGDYETAIKHFESLEARFPFGAYAQQAQLEIAYAYYKYDEPDSAIATLDRFLKRHPRHENADYAMYLKGLANFHRGASILDRLFPRDPTERDTRAARDAFNDFTTLVQRYPQSKYSVDAAQRLVFLHNGLARYEVNVAEYYMRRKAFVAAANRAKYVLENFQRTPAVADALAIQVEAYRHLGLTDLADTSLRVLRLNYPDHAFLALPAASPEFADE